MFGIVRSNWTDVEPTKRLYGRDSQRSGSATSNTLVHDLQRLIIAPILSSAVRDRLIIGGCTEAGRIYSRYDKQITDCFCIVGNVTLYSI